MSNQLIRNNKRDYSFDTVGGILIILVVIWHSFQRAGLGDVFEPVFRVLGFWMLWFIFKGGVFYKKKPFKVIWTTNKRRILLPYIIFSAIGFIFFYIFLVYKLSYNPIEAFYYQFKTLFLYGAVTGNQPLWFFIALFSARLLYTFIYNFINSNKNSFRVTGYIFLACLFIFPAVTLYALSLPLKLPRWPSYICLSTAFFWLGDCLKSKSFSNLFLIIIILIECFFWIFYPSYYDMLMCEIKYGNIWCFYLQSILGILIINQLSKQFFYNNNLLAKIGLNTLPVFCIHFIIITILSLLIPYNSISKSAYLISILLGEMVLLPIIIVLIKRSPLKKIIE